MSTAKPMTDDRRREIYLNQTGSTDLTPRQRRRADSKAHVVVRELPRTGRLRRRYDRKDIREVKRAAARFVALIHRRKVG